MSKTHVPAWRRLGLKLKYAKDTASSPSSAVREPPIKKRRIENAQVIESATKSSTVAKSAEDDGHSTSGTTQRLKKQVSFTADTKTTDGDSAVSIIPSEEVANIVQNATSSKKTSKTKPSTQPATAKLHNALEYLTEYYRSHSTWKFNKNRETWILKNALSTEAIPSSYNLLLAQYIHGLKSTNTRDRLRMQCITTAAGMASVPDSLETLVLNDGQNALLAFPVKTVAEDTKLFLAICGAPRVSLIRWALDPVAAFMQQSNGSNDGLAQSTHKNTAPQKKRKNRTAVVEYSSSSESSSSSSSSSDDSDDED